MEVLERKPEYVIEYAQCKPCNRQTITENENSRRKMEFERRHVVQPYLFVSGKTLTLLHEMAQFYNALFCVNNLLPSISLSGIVERCFNKTVRMMLYPLRILFRYFIMTIIWLLVTSQLVSCKGKISVYCNKLWRNISAHLSLIIIIIIITITMIIISY